MPQPSAISRDTFELDHIGVVARDLAATSADYERLGFSLTPVSQHWGATPGRQPVKWGTGNRCAMLRRGYLEIIAVIDASLEQNQLPRFLARFEGVHILAFGCADADAALRTLDARGFAIGGVSPLARRLPPPLDAHTARFRLLRFPLDTMPEGRVIAIQHETPELLRTPGLLDHPNGAVSLESVVVAVADLAEARTRYTRFLGEPSAAGRDVVTFALRAGEFVLATPDAIAARLPGARIPCLPYTAEFTVGVVDLHLTRQALRDRRVEHLDHGGSIVVPASLAGGAWCRFAPAP